MTKTKFINLTSHIITIEDVNGEILKLKSSNDPFRLQEHIYDSTINNGIQIMKVKYIVPKLPKYDPNVIYIVSKLVAHYVNRSDYIAPDTGKTAIRKQGRVQMIKRFYSYDTKDVDIY